jgi:hypothetical protein
MSNELESQLIVGINYVNKTTININKIDYSEVINVKSATSTVNINKYINVLTSNGYNVNKYNIITDVSKLNYIITASGMYGQYCGTDNNGNFVFKVLQITTIIDKNKNEGIKIPVNTKLILSKISSNKYTFEKKHMLINNVNNNNNNDVLQTTVNKVVNKTYDAVTNIGKPENVMPNTGGRSYKKHKQTRVKTLLKKYRTYKTRKNNKK